jgi:trans-2,3-dihydro-3-hydroxyanthranilate isomerase
MNQRKSYHYQVVDVFTRVPLEGNPLAVFLDTVGLAPEMMQRIARELNLSETVFVVPSERFDCVARLRIFTPCTEMDFAGHPTVGASFVLTQQGVVPAGVRNFSVQENVGAIAIAVDRTDGLMLWLRTPPVQQGPTIDKSEAAALLGLAPGELEDCAPQVLSAGNPTLFIALKGKRAVDGASLDSSKWSDLKRRYHPDRMCVFVFTPTPEGAYSRMFAPDYGVLEDPATGSATGPLAFYMMRHGLASAAAGSRLVSEQGTQMGRRSLLHVQVHGEQGKDGIDVGGFVTPLIDGELHL